MNTALIIYLFISTLGLGLSLADHGKPRKPGNGWIALLAYVIGTTLVLLAVY